MTFFARKVHGEKLESILDREGMTADQSNLQYILEQDLGEIIEWEISWFIK